jgi:signal transduction histidine kinase
VPLLRPVRRPRRQQPPRSLWWSASAACALLAAAGWLQTPAVPYLVVCVAATVAAVWIGRRQRTLGPVVAVLALVTFCALATMGQVALDRVVRSWDDTVAAITRHSAAVMHDELTALASDLRNSATKALDAPADPADAFAWLAPLARGDGERSIVLSRDGRPVAWSGTLRTVPDTSGAPFAVVRTPFYVALQATVQRGTARAVAVALLHAEPPADRLSRPLDETIAERTGVDGFALMPPSAGAPPIADNTPAAFEPAGVPLATVRPIPPQLEEAAERVTEQAQNTGALAFAVALVGFLVAEWRPRRAAPGRRLVALAVPLAALAIVPLNAFSNTSRLVDPTYFFSPVGGPYTASIGALGATSAIALLAAFAAARARARLRPRLLAVAIALVASLGAPFAVAYVAGGITPPGAAVPLTLWVGWQIALALGAAALLVGASVAVRSALAERQGLWPVVAVVIAGAAAVLGPILWVAPGGWPAWYAIPWCLAGAAAAFARGSRWRVFLSALVAALGSAVVVWGTTAQKRIVLAERDLAGLAVPDPNAVALLDRFGTELASAPPPVSRADLLHRYARSDLAAADYPVRLAVRAAGGGPDVTLELARFDTDTGLVAAIASEALVGRAVVLSEAAGSPGVQLVLAVPAANGSVTTVVVAPQTRLIAANSFAPLLGLAPDPGLSPPYTISLLEVVPERRTAASAPQGDLLGVDSAVGRGADSVAVQAAASGFAGPLARYKGVPVRWTRAGSALHGDWLVPTSAGPARAHVEVELRPFDALVQRAVLLVVLDLLAASLLWAVSVAGDGVLARWMMGHARRWSRSYRTQLTIVLFGFFVVPAVMFAAWSYRRLRSDDAEERALLVWQTLRGVASGGLDDLSTDAALVGTPILLYDDGALRSTSDSLYDALAPLGRFLRPDLELGLGLGNEVRASRAAELGGGRVLIGYRAVDAAGGDRVVLAAPARGDEAGLDTRRDDLGILVLFTTVLGAAAALGLSGLAARRFARPIDALRRAALAMAVGDREPDLAGDPPVEFVPVFAAFRRMAADFGESQRVLAWGEMARQVAHEIKNPLTPIRLGIQHLQRARAARRSDFDRILDQNAGRILAEIDRLDQIARAFSRYGSAPDERAPAEPTDIVHVVQDVVELERLGAGGGVTWGLTGADDAVVALARADDLREVLLNVLENARLARARQVSVHVAVERGASDRPHATPGRDGAGRAIITVDDDGEGIGADVLPRIFEPHFSTRTSGSGLGLALSRRIVDGWGGTIVVESDPGTGTRVTIVLALSVA